MLHIPNKNISDSVNEIVHVPHFACCQNHCGHNPLHNEKIILLAQPHIHVIQKHVNLQARF